MLKKLILWLKNQICPIDADNTTGVMDVWSKRSGVLRCYASKLVGNVIKCKYIPEEQELKGFVCLGRPQKWRMKQAPLPVDVQPARLSQLLLQPLQQRHEYQGQVMPV